MAAVDYFIKLDGIKGESADAKHKDEIDVESWSWGETNAGVQVGGGGGGAGKVAMQDFQFVMRLNKASPSLIKACATGQHIKKAVLSVRKAGGSTFDYLKVTMEDVLVSSFQQAGDTGGGGGVEQLSLNFAKIEFSYTIQNKDGSPGTVVTEGYDLRAQKSI